MALRIPRRIGAVVAAALASMAVLATTAAPSHAASDCAAPQRANAPTQYVAGGVDIDASVTFMCLVHDERVRQGLAPLQMYMWGANPSHKVLADNSANHLNDLIEHGQTGATLHIGSNGSTPSQRMAAYGDGASYWRIGEVVTPVGSTPQAAFDSFMNSPGHRALLLDPEFDRFAAYGNGKAPGGGPGGTYVVSLGVRR
jgi:uncharacterized protein YkwD